jgi:hypothetical protein
MQLKRNLSHIEMHSLCEIKDEEAQGYSSVKNEGKERVA